jgi:RimJ/RimL family protein N-acetyltransferase
MNKVLKEQLKKKLQKIFWIYPCNIFVINGLNEFKMVEPNIKCDFIAIKLDNCHRVGDFREEARISEYRDKLARKEIGYFAEYDGKMIGSIWATVNKAEVPNIVRTFMKLIPNEGLIHDIVTSEKRRGMGVGPFMVSRMTQILLKEYGLSRIIIDVNIRNHASLRMHEKLGFRIDHKMLYASVFGRSVLQLELKKYT